MPAPDRIRLMQGQMVDVIAQLPDGRQTSVSKSFLQLLRAAWTVLKEQLTNLTGLELKQITHVIVPVTSDAALQTIVRSLQDDLQQRSGALPQIPHLGNESLFKHARIIEAATAVGDKHVIDLAKKCIDGTFYRGGDHRYAAPLTDLKYAYGAVNSQAIRYIKDKLVESVVKSYLDRQLKNNKQVVGFMHEVIAFGDAVRNCQAQEEVLRAEAAAKKAARGNRAKTHGKSNR